MERKVLAHCLEWEHRTDRLDQRRQAPSAAKVEYEVIPQL